VLEAEQGVGDVEEVPDMQVRRPHPRLALAQVDRHAAVAFAVGAERDRPEQAARVGMDAGVEVVHLGGEVCEVEPTSVEVKSNEPERPPVDGAIHTDIGALHKAHIGVEQELLDTAIGTRGGSMSPHVRNADKTLEIGDRRWVHPGPEGGEVERDPVDRGRG